MRLTDSGTTPYRIHRKGDRRYPHWPHPWHPDWLFRSWQSEASSDLRFARRGWTPTMARWLMERDLRIAQSGRTPLCQALRTWWADRRRARACCDRHHYGLDRPDVPCPVDNESA